MTGREAVELVMREAQEAGVDPQGPASLVPDVQSAVIAMLDRTPGLPEAFVERARLRIREEAS